MQEPRFNLSWRRLLSGGGSDEDVFMHKGVTFWRPDRTRRAENLILTAGVSVADEADSVSAELSIYHQDAGDVWHYTLKFDEDDAISGIYDWLAKREGNVPTWILENVSYSMWLKLDEAKTGRIERENRLRSHLWDELRRAAL